MVIGRFGNKQKMVAPAKALPGREQAMPVPGRHAVLGVPLTASPPPGAEEIWLAMGCFWGAERLFWQLPGVYVTAVGYTGGYTPNPLYEEVCSGLTGHTEAVRVVYDPARIPVDALLKCFWEGHDPTQGMRQGNDIGTQYRSAIFHTSEAQRAAAERSARAYGAALAARGLGEVSTEIAPAAVFYYAEGHHQQYLHKHPGGYCGLGGTGVACPGVMATDER